jgi:hypothetical protein
MFIFGGRAAAVDIEAALAAALDIAPDIALEQTRW